MATEDLAYVVQLAKEFGQWGFFWVQHGTVYICLDGSGTGWSIGTWSEKVKHPLSVLHPDIAEWARQIQLSDCGLSDSRPAAPGEPVGTKTVTFIFPPNRRTNNDSVSS